MPPSPTALSATLPRRTLLRAGALSPLALASLASLPVAAASPAAAPAPAALKPIKLAWNTGAVCGAPIVVAQKQGFFAKHGLDVEYVNFAGSTEQLLEAIATGKADAGHGMALRWLKPLEQGFDVKIAAGVHGGCMRLLAPKAGGVTDLAQLRGRTVGVSDLASPAKHFFSILLARQGIDPNKDVEWRVYPGDLLGVAVEKGEAQAIAHWDPVAYQFLKSGNLVEIASNLSGDYANRVCCVIGVRNSLLREDRPAVQALVRAVLEAQDFSARNPAEAARAYQEYAPKASVEDLTAQLASHTHHHHPQGADIRHEVAQYAEALKSVQVFKPTTDSAKFADRVTTDVLG
ncbi:ABC transporter substrate-binding protein [Azospirillum picis]|uniref:NitT/TauT family transport system substrate-binding protein n=1 Tax=Azospirillum picis TaxID=488438 RepID=A0ABU0MN09_9PROT|nr:ABC transporter substrate-binding protein [Azospirillum picis]MBP2300755.1 NitT/TauT family transport system substrate-binding protein [Azospirillum picis]MDQ0534724.1 NitT/TauT family transport system substrate-binding protein [Azospirillum picis]